MMERIEVRVTLGTFSKGNNKALMESMYEDLRKACVAIDKDYGGAGFVKLCVSLENGEAVRKAKEK